MSTDKLEAIAQRLVDSADAQCNCATDLTDDEIKLGKATLEHVAGNAARACGCREAEGSLQGHRLVGRCKPDATREL